MEDRNPHTKRYETKDVRLALPKEWFRECINKEAQKIINRLGGRVGNLEAEIKMLEKDMTIIWSKLNERNIRE